MRLRDRQRRGGDPRRAGKGAGMDVETAVGKHGEKREPRESASAQAERRSGATMAN